jgi:hypothetical protein
VNYSYDPTGNVAARTESAFGPPQITAHPVNQIAAPGESATFSVMVADARDVAFQWKRNDAEIAEATGDSLVLTNVGPDDEGTNDQPNKYSVVVTNSAGSVTSKAAELLLDSDHDGLPDSWEKEKFKNPDDPDPNRPPNPANQRSETDPDKDGITNLDEFLDNTDPTNRGSLRPRLIAYSDAAGSVTVTPMKLSYDLGDSVTLTATPLSPNVFIGWAGDLKGTDNPATITMDRNKTVWPRFASGPASLPLGLIALWRGETDAQGRAIDVIGGHHGACFKSDVTVPAVTTAGKIGRALDFDGTVHVRVPDDAALRPRRVTMEAWVFPTFGNVGPDRTIIARGSSTVVFGTWSLGLFNRNPDFISHGGHHLDSLPIPANEWTHLAATWDGRIKRLYVDGVLVNRMDPNENVTLGELVYDPAPVPLTIGSDWRSNASSDRFVGQIDEVALYNRALRADEIRGIYDADFLGKDFSKPYFTSPSELSGAVLETDYRHQFVAVLGTSPLIFSLSAGMLPSEMTLSLDGVVSGVPRTKGIFDFIVRATDAAGAFAEQKSVLQVFAPVTAPAGLVGWWRAENNAQDSAGTNHGELRNGAAFAAGRVGQAFVLDGKDDCIEIPDAESLRSSSVTLEAWVAFDVTSGEQVLIAKVDGNVFRQDSYALSLGFGSLTGLREGLDSVIRAPFAPEPGSWHHLAYTFDNAKQFLYIDGVQVASKSAFTATFFDDQPLLLGCTMKNGVRRSFLHEAAIYNRALSSAEIASIFNAGAAGKQPS